MKLGKKLLAAMGFVTGLLGASAAHAGGYNCDSIEGTGDKMTVEYFRTTVVTVDPGTPGVATQRYSGFSTSGDSGLGAREVYTLTNPQGEPGELIITKQHVIGRAGFCGRGGCDDIGNFPPSQLNIFAALKVGAYEQTFTCATF